MTDATRKYGLDHATWLTAKDEILQILLHTARDRALITYGDITRHLTAVNAHPGSYVFTALLREVCRDEFARSGVQLCALVVSKATGRPGGGYFHTLVCAEDDILVCWQAECEAVYAYFSGNDT
jgi:hypothetical protein